jgi:carboxyl-terminal processing protease
MTESPPISRRDLLLAGLFAFLLTVICGTIGIVVMSDPDIDRAFSIPAVALQIEREYSGQVNWDKLFDSARKAMFADLDRFSDYVEPRTFKAMDEEMTGAYTGIGVSIVRHELGLLVMAVREDGPSAKVGLMTGDIIIAVDSTSLEKKEVQQSTELLRGPEGSSVSIGVFRPSTGDTLSISVTRQRINFQHIPFAGFTPDSMIYVRLLDFDAGAADDLHRAIDSLMGPDPNRPRGMILDLRGNPGGLFTEAFETADLFLEAGQFIVGTDARSRWNREIHKATGSDITKGLPMVVLVDRGSASASEIVSGALKQSGRAELVGDTTFGKGLVQGFTRFQDGSGVRLTISRYYLQGNVYLNQMDSVLHDTGTGLPPDKYVDLPENDPFVGTLEGSLLLSEFAHQHQDEIIEGPPLLGPDSTWASQFAVYAASKNFDFISPRTEAALVLLLTARVDGSSKDVLAGAQNLYDQARRLDRQLFVRYHDYIDMRLRQEAYERKFGTWRAYGEVIVRERPDIRIARELLKGKPRT